jgi:hypothetical protein
MNTATVVRKGKSAQKVAISPRRRKVVVESIEVIQLDADGQRLAAEGFAALRKHR